MADELLGHPGLLAVAADFLGTWDVDASTTMLVCRITSPYLFVSSFSISQAKPFRRLRTQACVCEYSTLVIQEDATRFRSGIRPLSVAFRNLHILTVPGPKIATWAVCLQQQSREPLI